MGVQDCNNLLTTLKMENMCLGFLEIYKMSSPTIRFVYSLTLFSMLMRLADHATNNNLSSRMQADSE